MTSAIEAVQESMMGALQSHEPLMEEITGIYDGPPPRAVFPYLAMATGASIDWSHKSGFGRELSLAITVHDDGASAARLHQLMALVEEALGGGLDDPDGWKIVTFGFRRTRISRSAINPWSGVVEYRVRCLKN